MKYMNDIEKCPYCGNHEFVKGVQTVGPADKVLSFKAQALYHVICLNCGTVVRTFVKEPKKLVTKR